jgi:hypothetical protein
MVAMPIAIVTSWILWERREFAAVLWRRGEAALGGWLLIGSSGAGAGEEDAG